jgi:hypothetical protein
VAQDWRVGIDRPLLLLPSLHPTPPGRYDVAQLWWWGRFELSAIFGGAVPDIEPCVDLGCSCTEDLQDALHSVSLELPVCWPACLR